MSELIKGSDSSEEPSEERTNDDGGKNIPKEKHGDAMAGNFALFPCDAWVHEKGENCGEKVGDDGVDPESSLLLKTRRARSS